MTPEMELDFEAALRVAGISIAPGRHAIMLEAFRSWRGPALVLDGPTPHAHEPVAVPHPVPSLVRA